LRGQKKTGCARRAHRAEFLFLFANPLSIHGFERPGPEIFSCGITAAKGARVPITAMHRWKLDTARAARVEAELRRETGRTGWPGQTQLKPITN